MAATPKSKSEFVVALDPMVVYRDRSGAQVGVYEGARIPRDAIDPADLKHHEENGIVGSEKDAEKAAADDSES